MEPSHQLLGYRFLNPQPLDREEAFIVGETTKLLMFPQRRRSQFRQTGELESRTSCHVGSHRGEGSQLVSNKSICVVLFLRAASLLAGSSLSPNVLIRTAIDNSRVQRLIIG